MADAKQKNLDAKQDEVIERVMDRAKTGSDRVVEDARVLFYKAMHNETAGIIKELAQARRFDACEDAMFAYGVYLELHPDALEVLAPTN